MPAKKKPKSAPMVMVGPGADEEELELEEEEEEEEPSEESEGEDDGEEERKKPRAKKDEEDSEDEEDDERVGHGEDDEDDEKEKAKKPDRESRKARRDRQRRARQRQETEINFLREQNDRLEKRVLEIDSRIGRGEAASIDTRINNLQSQMKVADQVLARAHEEGTGEDVVEATNIRDKLKETLNKLTSAKEEFSRRRESEGETVDPRVTSYASSWLKEHPWYNPKSADKDARAVAVIDNSLVQEGYDPRTPEYWDELSDRVERKLPHKLKDSRNGRDDSDEDDEEERRPARKAGNGPKFSAGGRERPLAKNQVYVDPERKKALIEAGVWDDKVLRNRYLKKYAEYDRENKPRGRSAR